MGYRGGAPHWVYKKDMAIQASSYENQIALLRKRIEELESENEKLREKIRELENRS